MKKAAVIVAAVILILTLASCSGLGANSGKQDQPAGQTELPQDDGENVALFNGDKIKLNYEIRHKDLLYLDNLSQLESSGVFSLRNIDYTQNGEVTLNVRIMYFEYTSIDEVIEDSDVVMTDKTVNGLVYKYFEQDFPFDDRTVPGHTYVYNFDGTTYTISFISTYDTSAFESVFMANVRFEKE